jgi:cytochrome P450
MSTATTMRRAVQRVVRPLYIRGTLLKERVKSGVAWNPLADSYHQHPVPMYDRLRNDDPIHYSELIGAWVFSRYEDVDAVLRDYKRFSNDSRNATNAANDLAAELNETRSILALDPPDHTRLRGLVSQAFTPKSIEGWRPRIEAVVARLMDDLDARVARGERHVDMLEALAIPLPITVIAEMLGVPPEDLPKFKEWSDHVARTLEPTITEDEARVAQHANEELGAYFEQIIEQRRADPQDDIISQLIAAEEEGDKLTHDELLVSLRLILIAGNETTTNLIGNGLLALLKHPEQLELLRREPELMESAVEELLRYDSAVQTDGRTALEDMEWDGHQIKRGQQVILLLGSANHDPSEFPDPERLDITRGSKRHMSFGRGIHHCLGAPLARMEAQVAFTRLLERFETLRLADETRFKDHIVLRGLKELPVDLTPVRAQVAATTA